MPESIICVMQIITDIPREFHKVRKKEHRREWVLRGRRQSWDQGLAEGMNTDFKLEVKTREFWEIAKIVCILKNKRAYFYNEKELLGVKTQNKRQVVQWILETINIRIARMQA